MEERENKISVASLIVQTKDLPDAGIDLEGSVSFNELDLDYDGRFDLDNAELHYRLHVAPVKQSIYVTGFLAADVMGMCDRCAEWAPLHISDNEVFHSYVNENFEPVDLTEDIREDTVLMFPDCFHCSEDCKGICPQCGQNLNEGTCNCSTQSAWDDEESPWASLPDLDDK